MTRQTRWRRGSIALTAASALLLTGCARATAESPEHDSPDTPPAQAPTVEEYASFGYDYSTIDVPEDITENYGDAAAANIVFDAFTPMEVIKSNQALYDTSEKNEDTYLPLAPFLTSDAWEAEKRDGDGNVEDGNHIINAYAISCTVQDDGTSGSWYVKEGHEPTVNDDDYSLMTCDSPQNIAENVKIEDIRITTLKKKDRPKDAEVSDVPEHIVVHSTVTHKFTGRASDGQPVSQEFVQNIRSYMVPDPLKKNHWLIDAADWTRDYGETTYG